MSKVIDFVSRKKQLDEQKSLAKKEEPKKLTSRVDQIRLMTLGCIVVDVESEDEENFLLTFSNDVVLSLNIPAESDLQEVIDILGLDKDL